MFSIVLAKHVKHIYLIIYSPLPHLHWLVCLFEVLPYLIYKYKYLNLPYGNMRLGNSTKHMDVSFVWRMKTCWSQSILNSLIAILLWPKAHQARSYFLMLYKSFSSLAHINGLKVKNQNSNVKKLGLSIRKEICVA